MSLPYKGLNLLQKLSMTVMAVLTILTFVGANLHALLWQSSDWLVSTVLPAVVIELTNEERADNSASPLQRNSTLDAAAKLKAEHMADNEYFSHFSPDGVSPWHWFQEAGYLYAHAGENLAIHFTDSSEVVEAWMDSPTHRENIVNNKYTEIGVGTAKGEFDGFDTVYVVQLFGTPAIAPTPIDTPEVLAIAEPAPTTQLESAVVEVPVETAQPTSDLPATSVAEETIEIQESPLATEVNEITQPEAMLVAEESPVLTADASETVVNEEVIEETESNPVQTTESLLTDENLAVSASESGVVIESSVITTSSGLEVAETELSSPSPAPTTFASVATQPNALLQLVYTVLAIAVVMMLGTSIVMEARRFNYQQVAYGFLLLFGMGGLWFLNSLLTTGAVIV